MSANVSSVGVNAWGELVMYASGGRSIRSGYGFAGEPTPTGYPIAAMHPSGVFGANPQPIKQREISFDTSSKEPYMMRSRVFVGNMNTNTISREDIIRLFSTYGTLLGVTVFKGYAFIQFANANDADLSIRSLNGYNWNGSVLDVKLAITGMKSHDVSSTVSTNNGVKRATEKDNWTGEGATVKKERSEDYGTDLVSQGERNQRTAVADNAHNGNLYQSGMPDTMICGACRFVTSDFEQFRDHRKSPCIVITKKDKDLWRCSMCEEACTTGGALINHASERHNVKLLKALDD